MFKKKRSLYSLKNFVELLKKKPSNIFIEVIELIKVKGRKGHKRMSKKENSSLSEIKDIVLSLKNDMISMKKDMISMKKDIVSLKNDMISVKKDIVSLKNDMISVKKDIVSLRNDMTEGFRLVNERIDRIEERLDYNNLKKLPENY